jgi:hypothetical protein
VSPMGRSDVKRSLTRQRRREVVENDAYGAFARRVMRAYGRRVADGDIEALSELVALGDQVEAAIRDAVIGLREYRYAWSEIASRLGVTRQAAQQRWGRGE